LTYNDDDHAASRFSTNKPSTEGKDNDGHGNSDDGEVELGIMAGGRHDNKELYGEAEEEEEIKLQKGDVDLKKVSCVQLSKGIPNVLPDKSDNGASCANQH
jgi:hypothetical protein